MQSLIQTIKSINIRQILTVFLAGCLLIISTACSQGNVAQAGGKAYTETAKRAMSDTYDDYDANQGFKGGMNGYNDDRRYNAETAAKAKALVDTARQRKADDLGEFTDNVLERSVINGDVNEKATKAFTNKLENNKDKAANYIQDKSENLKDNLSKVPGATKEVVKEAANTAQDAVEDATRATSKTAKEIKGNFEDLS